MYSSLPSSIVTWIYFYSLSTQLQIRSGWFCFTLPVVGVFTEIETVKEKETYWLGGSASKKMTVPYLISTNI